MFYEEHKDFTQFLVPVKEEYAILTNNLLFSAKILTRRSLLVNGQIHTNKTCHIRFFGIIGQREVLQLVLLLLHSVNKTSEIQN